MSDRKRKRHESLHEGGGSGKTVKGIFKKDDIIDDSLSASDWGLMIDESVKIRRRAHVHSVKLDQEPLTLPCCWDACHEIFSVYREFISHLKEHLDHYCTTNNKNDTFTCHWTDCTHKADSLYELNQHSLYHGYHTKLKCIGRNVEIRSKLPECTQCEKFVLPIVPHGYKCEWEHCGDTLPSIYDFIEHVKIHVFHNPKSSKEGVINCGWKACKTVRLPSQFSLSQHVRIHTTERMIACPTCGNLFANKTKFCDHRLRQIPINLQSYLCSQCSKFFPSERLLRDHMRMHVNHYKCSMCEMTCPNPSILAKHIRYRHVDEKPFKCHQCDYQGVNKHNLVTHLKKHRANDGDGFSCNDCDFTCKSSYGLEKHLQREHGKGWNNVYECHNCKKKFGRGGFLTKHLMRVHDYHWPSGHSRFRYKEDQDGIFRLQTVRYETLDVTEEIIKGKMGQNPPPKGPMEFNVNKIGADFYEVRQASTGNDDGEKASPEGSKVVITIDDVDSKGNVVKSQTIPSEIICSNIKPSFPTDLFPDCDAEDL